MSVAKIDAIRGIGVIGAGLMGNGIAHASLAAGYPVTLVDAFETALPKAVATMTKNMERQVAKNTLSAADKGRGAGAADDDDMDYGALADVDLVIEAVPEIPELKLKIYGGLKGVLKPEAIIASNTSSISITKLAAMTDRPEQFIGMHFFNPVPMMKLLEVIRGIATSDATYETVLDVAAKLGKTVATAQDAPGFIVNRILWCRC